MTAGHDTCACDRIPKLCVWPKCPKPPKKPANLAFEVFPELKPRG